MKLGRKKFIELFDFKSKSKIQAKDGLPSGKYPFYTSSNIQSKFINECNYEGESLIFGTGGKASVHFEKGKFSTSTDCLIAQAKDKNQIDVNYSFYYFKSNPKILEDGFHGAGLKHISKAYISDILIPLPPLPDQIRIAQILSQAESLIAQRKQSISLLDELLKSTFLEMFGDPVRNEKGWKMMSGEKYLEKLTVGVVIKPASHYVEKGVIALRSLNIKPNRIDLNNLVYFSKESNDKELAKSILRTGDVVFVRTGVTGTAAIITKELDGCNCIDLIITRPKEKIINPRYLVFFFNSDIGKRIVLSKQVGGIQQHFNIGAMKSLKIPVPPIALQTKFANVVEKVETLKTQYQQSLTELQNMYGVLSQKAFRGAANARGAFERAGAVEKFKIRNEEELRAGSYREVAEGKEKYGKRK